MTDDCGTELNSARVAQVDVVRLELREVIVISCRRRARNDAALADIRKVGRQQRAEIATSSRTMPITVAT